MVPFESLGAVSYSPSIVTMAVSVAVCEIFSIKCTVTLKTGQGSFKVIGLIDRMRVPIRLRSNYGAILYRLRDIATYWLKIAKFL